MQALILPRSVASHSGSDRTWSASHGITFASSTDRASSQSAFHPTIRISSHRTRLQEDTRVRTETQTQEDTGTEELNHDSSGNAVANRKSTHQLDIEFECATRSSSSSDVCSSAKSAHPEGRPPSDDETIRSPLGFHIPESKLRDAMLAEPTSTASYWHFSLYQGPGGDKDKVRVHYCKSKDNTEKVAQLFLGEEVIGFDIEWKPSSSARDGITKNVALIQIASEARILLAHIARYPNAATSEKMQRVDDFVAPSLKKILYEISITSGPTFHPF